MVKSTINSSYVLIIPTTFRLCLGLGESTSPGSPGKHIILSWCGALLSNGIVVAYDLLFSYIGRLQMVLISITNRYSVPEGVALLATPFFKLGIYMVCYNIFNYFFSFHFKPKNNIIIIIKTSFVTIIIMRDDNTI